MKLPQAVLDKFALSTNLSGYALNFWGYYGLMWSWWHCKESAGLTIPTIDGKQYLICASSEAIIKEFKRLAKLFGIRATVYTHTNVKIRIKDLTVYQIGGWFNKNILTREMGRFLLRQAEETLEKRYRPIESVQDFVERNYLATPATESFLTNLKKNVETADISRLNYNRETGSGFLRWIQNGFLIF